MSTNNFKRALKSAARRPVTPARNNNRGPKPSQEEVPIIVLRVQVIKCENLRAKDKHSFINPYVVISVLNARQQTPVSKRTCNPMYNPEDSTFDFPLSRTTADKLGALELVVWDKDMLSKDYLGECALPLEDWFVNRPFEFEDSTNPFDVTLLSTRPNTVVTGTITLKLGFITAAQSESPVSFQDVFNEPNKRLKPSLVSAPPTEGVGTIRSHHAGPAFNLQDDGGLSSDEEDGDEDDFVDAPSGPSGSASHLTDLYTSSAPSALIETKLLQSHVQQPTAVTITATSSNTPTNSGHSKTPTHIPPTPTAVPAPTLPSPRIRGVFNLLRVKFPRSLSGLSVTRFSSSSNNNMATAYTLIPSSSSAGPASTTSAELGKKGARKNASEPATYSGSGTEALATTTSNAGAASTPLPRGSNSTRKRGKSEAGYRFGGGNDVIGLVTLEVQSAEDLPRLRNRRDMDPFVVISFGKKIFRTRVIRHSRNPFWDEKLLFHVRRSEISFNIQLMILDWVKPSSNDHIGDVRFNVKELLDCVPQPNPETGLYETGNGRDKEETPMKEYEMPLVVAKNVSWDVKHTPMISFRAEYQTYDSLRQRFWRQFMKQYDADGTNALSHIEMTSMLDSLGSTLSSSTISNFFNRYAKKAHEDELSFEEAIICLEEELNRPDDQKKRLDAEDPELNSSVSATPILQVADRAGKVFELDQLDFSGPAPVQDVTDADIDKDKIPAPTRTKAEPMQVPLHQVAAPGTPGGGSVPFTPNPRKAFLADSLGFSGYAEKELVSFSSRNSPGPAMPGAYGTTLPPPPSPGATVEGSGRFKMKGGAAKRALKAPRAGVERVINVRSCPLCHRPNMNSKTEVDIMTHIAICASQDWNRVDRIVVGNFVTASQAQRKWYTKVIGKLSSGDYKLGANSANIILQNRLTGQLEEEKMQVYVRLGIRLLYKGMKGRMEGARARKLLKSLSIKQGIKYDSPESAKDIPGFIEFHNLNVSEILDPLDSFRNFNEFFYRKLKPSARPVEALDDPYRLVSAADCRLVVFETVHEATRIWIKGREFSVGRLLGNAYKDEAERCNGGALAIFRLAPGDYHRFHSPVDGTIGKMTYISGEYYTVNPQAIRTALDVYGENVRKVIPVDSPQFGRVMTICVGAMMVGSILTTVEEGQGIKRGQELGYFAFGGSTIVLLFEKGVVEWDEDLLINGRASLETLVRVGMGLGNGTRRNN